MVVDSSVHTPAIIPGSNRPGAPSTCWNQGCIDRSDPLVADMYELQPWSAETRESRGGLTFWASGPARSLEQPCRDAITGGAPRCQRSGSHQQWGTLGSALRNGT